MGRHQRAKQSAAKRNNTLFFYDFNNQQRGFLTPEWSLNRTYRVSSDRCPTQPPWHTKGGSEGVFWSILQYIIYRLAAEDGATAADGMPKWEKPRTYEKCLQPLAGGADSFNDEDYKQQRKDMIKHAAAVALECAYFTGRRDDTLRERLVGTGDAELVYAARKDRVLGCGYSEEDAQANRGFWGSNYLGKTLMEIRACIKEGKQWEAPELQVHTSAKGWETGGVTVIEDEDDLPGGMTA